MSAVPASAHKGGGQASARVATVPATSAAATAPTAPRAARPLSQRTDSGFWWAGSAASAAWLVLGLLTWAWPNKVVGLSDWAYTQEFAGLALTVATLLAFATLLGRRAGPWVARIRPAGAWLIALGLGFALWEVLTAKTAALPAPFFAPPQSLAEVYIEDFPRLADSARNSLVLLATGIGCGAAVGFVLGVVIGWSRAWGYWVHPVLRFLGPVPSTALLPISFYFFPSSYSTAVFLIALATAFPVTILTWSGVASVQRTYYDVARTMGASPWFLVFRVAIPAALPQVFVGLFMGLGHAFATLVVAEMMGVKSGLGWYLTWAQGWANYPGMYGALLVMAVLFSGLITLLFVVRDRVLQWQKGIVQW
jgi:NitT/TauT family transport system permease protein